MNERTRLVSHESSSAHNPGYSGEKEAKTFDKKKKKSTSQPPNGINGEPIA